MIGQILLWAAIASNIGAALYSVLAAHKRLKKLDAMIAELENTRAIMYEYIVRR